MTHHCVQTTEETAAEPPAGLENCLIQSFKAAVRNTIPSQQSDPGSRGQEYILFLIHSAGKERGVRHTFQRTSAH